MVFTGLNQKTTIYLALMSGVSLKAAEATFAQLSFGQKVRLTTAMLKEQALAWLATPMGMATVAVTGISLLISGISWLNQKIEENKQKLKEVAQEASKQADESAKAVSILSDLKTQLVSGTKSSNELTSAFKEQLKAMGYTEGQIDALINKYGGLSGAIDEATRKALENARTDAHTDVATSSKSLETTYDPYGMSGDTKSTVRLGEYDSIGNELRNKILEIMKPVAIDMDSLMGTITMGANSDSAEDIYAYYQGLQQVVQLIQDTASKTNNKELLNSSVYKEASETLQELGESAKLYGDAIDRLNNADAKIELANFLKTNDIATQEDFDSYIKGIEDGTIGMVDGKEASDSYKQVLIDVANDAFPQFSNAAKNAGKEVNEMTDSLDSLSSAIKAAESAFELFNEVEKDFNSTGIISAENIQKILNKFPELEDELYEYIVGMRSGASIMDLLKTKSDDMATMSIKAFKRMYLSSNSVSKDIKDDYESAFKLIGLEWDNTQSVMANVNTQIVDANGQATQTFVEQWTEACKLAGANVSTFAQGISALLGGDFYDGTSGVYRVQGKGIYYKDGSGMDGKGTNLVNVKAMELIDSGQFANTEKGRSDAYKAAYNILSNQMDKSWENQAEFERRQKEFEERMKQYAVTSDDKSGSNGRDKDADPLKADIDRYVLLQNAVDEAEQSLKRLESTEDSLLGADKLRNLEQQAEAYEKIAKAYNDMAWENKQERNDIRWRMEQNGFAFSGDFNSTNISTNYAENIQRMYDKYKAMPYATEADKDARAKYLEEIKDMEAGYEKILDLNKSVYDNENKGIDALKGQNEELENQRQYWEDFVDDQVSDIEHQINIRKHRGTQSFDDDISDYEKIKEIAHQRANDWRALGYDDNSEEVQKWQKAWLDADKNIRDTTEGRSDDLIEDIEHALEVGEALNTLSLDDKLSYYEKIKEIAHQRADDWRAMGYDDNSPEVQKWQKTWLDADAKIKDSFNDTLDKIERATKKETDRLQELADEAGKLVEKYEALKQVKSSQFDFDNSMVEALQDIDNQLATSLVSAQYLDPDERSLIFNEEDYKLLSGKIKDLQEWNERAAQAYWNEINNLGEDELYLKESITAEYERQLALKNKELEVYKAEVDVKKKEQALNNVLAEKNVKMLVGDHWEWVADVDKVRQATEEANLARNRLTTAKTKKLQQLELNKHDELIAKSNEEQAAYEQQTKIIEKATEKLKEAYEDYVDPVEDIGVLVNQLKNKGISGFSDALNHLTSVMGGVSINYGTGNNSSYNSYVGGSSSSGGSRLSKTTYTYVKGNDGRTYEVMDGSRTNGEGTVVKGKDSNGNTTYTNNYGEIVKTVKNGYASGTKFASPGWHKVDENGQETYVSDDGVFHNFAGGELVFNNDQVQRLFEFSKYAPQNMMAEMVSKYATPMINLPVRGAGGGNTTYQFNGGIHIDEVADYNDFMLQLTQKANAIHQITKNE